MKELTMTLWKEISDGYFSYEDDSWTLYLRIDESGALLELYDGTALITTKTWGPTAISRGDGGEWCKKQSLNILDSEKRKRN